MYLTHIHILVLVQIFIIYILHLMSRKRLTPSSAQAPWAMALHMFLHKMVFTVNIIDVNAGQLEKAIATITKNFDRQVAKGTATEEQKADRTRTISDVYRYGCRR